MSLKDEHGMEYGEYVKGLEKELAGLKAMRLIVTSSDRDKLAVMNRMAKEIEELKAKQFDRARAFNAVSNLEMVLLDPDGKVSISGSDEDKQIIDEALKELRHLASRWGMYVCIRRYAMYAINFLCVFASKVYRRYGSRKKRMTILQAIVYASSVANAIKEINENSSC